MPDVNLPDQHKGFLKRLFPKELRKYIPGQKLIAGALAFVVAEVFGADAQVVDLPLVGEVNVQEFVAGLAVYLWPGKAE